MIAITTSGVYAATWRYEKGHEKLVLHNGDRKIAVPFLAGTPERFCTQCDRWMPAVQECAHWQRSRNA